jgi:hypothetical protein
MPKKVIELLVRSILMTRSNISQDIYFLHNLVSLLNSGWPAEREYWLLLPPDLQEKREKARIVWSLRHPGKEKMSVGDLVVLGLWRCVIRCSVSTFRLNLSTCARGIVIYTLIRTVLIFRERRNKSSLDRPDPTSEWRVKSNKIFTWTLHLSSLNILLLQDWNERSTPC